MAKRLHDTEIWHKEWYCNLSQTHKLLVQYLFDNCDCAGVFEANYKIMQFLIGAEITEKEKVYYYVLAYTVSQPVLLIKTPTTTAGIKTFLGCCLF